MAECEVTIFDIREPDNAELLSKVKFIKGDLTNETDVHNALVGQEVVFHVASPHPNAPPAVLEKVNVRYQLS